MDPKTAASLNDFFAAAAIVSGIAIAVGFPLFLRMRWCGESLFPRWKAPGVPWQTSVLLMTLFPIGLVGFHAVVGMVSNEMVRFGIGAGEDESVKQLRQLRATLIMAPLFAVMYYVVRKVFQVPAAGGLPRQILLGICGWMVLMPLTFAVHFVVLQFLQALGIDEEQHPIIALKPQDDGTGGVLFALAVCLGTPVIEECLFRGLLVPWAGQRQYAAWGLMSTGFVLAGLTGTRPVVPLLFVVVLCIPLLWLQFVASPRRWPRRTLSGIIASSAVFAAAHSGVWPSPIPLFVLACGLAYLTARSRSIVPAVVVHGLFNTVSFVMLCRGSAF